VVHNDSTFSILERIDVGETRHLSSLLEFQQTFSILERIDVGETCRGSSPIAALVPFQYPRTDRRG